MRRRLRNAASAVLLLSFLGGAPGQAQPFKLSPELQLLQDMTRSELRGAGLRPAAVDFSTPEPTVKVHLQLRPGVDKAVIAARHPRAVLRSQNGRYATAEIPLSELAALADDPDVEYVEESRLLEPLMGVARSSSTSGGLYLGVLNGDSTDFADNQGQGVVVGVVDTGIDFRHKDFIIDGSPNRTRILALWDQTDTGGPSPGGIYNYGTEWAEFQINDELDGTPAGLVRESDTNGHGTHVTGTAAGNGSATDGDEPAGTYTGIAPKADIIFVKTTFSTINVIDAVNYIVNRAALTGRRAVINLSLGIQSGAHDGTSLGASQVNVIAASTPVFIAAGNEQTDDLHAKATVGSGGTVTISANRFASTSLFRLSFWAPAEDAYTVRVTAMGETGFVEAASGASVTGTVGPTSVTVSNARNTHPTGDKELSITVFQFSGITPANFSVLLTRTANGGSGRVDGWSANHTLVKFTSNLDPTGTLSDWATGTNSIAVGAYGSKCQWVANDGSTSTDSTCVSGEISVFSGRGPTRPTGGPQPLAALTKPDIAAPGERVSAALSQDASPPPSVFYTAKDGRHHNLQGTSMATPIATGLGALILQRKPHFTPAQVRQHLQAFARTDAKVTGHGAVPNNVFGPGKALACLFPAPVASVTAQALGTSSVTFNWSASTKAASYRLYYATNPAVLAATAAAPPHALQNLAANTVHRFDLRATNACGDGEPGLSPQAATRALPIPAAVLRVHRTSATVTWAALPASPPEATSYGYALAASTAPDLSGNKFTWETSDPGRSAGVVTGLALGTTYFLELSTLNPLSERTTVRLSSIATPTGPFSPEPAAADGVTASAVRANWDAVENAPGTAFRCEASTAADFSGTVLEQQTTGSSAEFTGLSVNTRYHFRVRAVGGPPRALGSVATHAVPPALASPAFAGVFQASMTASWSAPGNPAGTVYEAALSTLASFGAVSASVTTTGLGGVFGDLDANTDYLLRVSAVNADGVRTSWSAAASTPTLTLAPTAHPLGDFLSVTSSITVRWTPLPDASRPTSCAGYRVEASTTPEFQGAIRSKTGLGCGLSSLPVGDLLPETAYHLRIGALNSAFVAHYLVLGSTRTGRSVEVSSAMPSRESLLVSLPSTPFQQVRSLHVEIPANRFPPGTAVSISADVSSLFKGRLSSQASLRPLGEGVGFNIHAGGRQPSGPVILRLFYDPDEFPAGTDPNTIVMARFVPADDQWTLLATQVYPQERRVEALTDHFSLFAPFFLTAAATVDSAQVFPIPWMPGSGDAGFDAPRLSFTNLPADGTVEVYTLLGELAWKGGATVGGTVAWDGVGARGARIGSGTYLAVIKGGGGRKVRRIVIVR